MSAVLEEQDKTVQMAHMKEPVESIECSAGGEQHMIYIPTSPVNRGSGQNPLSEACST